MGGTGFYFRALYQGLIDVPEGGLREVRQQLEARDTTDLYCELEDVDPQRAREISQNDRLSLMISLSIIITITN